MNTKTRTAPQHGERRYYLRGCRCNLCSAAHRRYCKQYQLATLHQPIRVDAAPVAAHLDSLADQGYSHRQIAALVSRCDGEISKLRLRQQRTISPALALIYLNLRPKGVTPNLATVDSTGTVRRGRALHAIGHPVYDIAPRIPMAKNGLGLMLKNPPATVLLSVANGMTAAYQQLRWRPGTSIHARNRAARLGWHGPMAWEAIDDPACQPDDGGPYQPPPKNGRDTLRRAEIRHLLTLGESAATIARRMGVSEKYIHDLTTQGLDEPTYAAA
ncbi:hypothetical protein [Streptomyces sp. NPDC058653]|uniref:hypothetical protein n=1 Tax=Streptomyces sp. NPDC058653 TaxID=3346576 RepID=UPI0036537B9B